MTARFTLRTVAALAVAFGTSSIANADLMLDLQPTGGTTATGYQSFEVTNQDTTQATSGVMKVFDAASHGLGSDVTVTYTTSNLPDGNLDFRSVARNGADGATNINNDWIGADARTTGVDVTLTFTISGLLAGNYNWTSYHHDGGVPTAPTASNGNIGGSADYSFTDATGTTTVLDGILFSRQDVPNPVFTLNRAFTSNGGNIVFSVIKDNGQDINGTLNGIFAYAGGIEIRTAAIPEPTSLLVVGLGMVGIAVRRRK